MHQFAGAVCALLVSLSGTAWGQAEQLDFTAEACFGGGAETDRDADTVNDACEFAIAETFAPFLQFYDEEGARDRYTYWVAQRQGDADVVRVFYALGYHLDPGDAQNPDLLAFMHLGDSEFIVLDVEHLARGRWQVARATLSAHFGAWGTEPRQIEFDAMDLDFLEPLGLQHHVRVHVAENKHGNYRSRLECDQSGVWTDRCDNPAGGEFVEVLPERNLGSLHAPLIEDPVVHDGNREWFWRAERFCGWQVEPGGDRDDCTKLANAYFTQLVAMGMTGGPVRGPDPSPWPFALPVRGVDIAQEFNAWDRYHGRPNEAHTGIDYLPDGDDGVYATAAGEIVDRVNNGEGCAPCDDGPSAGCRDHGLGNAVVLRHAGGVHTVYGHLESFDAGLGAVGDAVEQGQRLGTMGGTGSGCDDSYVVHLHFETKAGAPPDYLRNPQPGINAADDPDPGPTWGYARGDTRTYGYENPAFHLFVGRTAGGWDPRVTPAFREAYLRVEKDLGSAGSAETAGMGGPASLVHPVRDRVLVQDFFQGEARWRYDGSAGDTALVRSFDDGAEAHSLRAGFWATWRCLEVGGEDNGGAVLLGAPLTEELGCLGGEMGCVGDPETACEAGVTRQVFERGYLDWGCPAVDNDGDGIRDGPSARCRACAENPAAYPDCHRTGPAVQVHLCHHDATLGDGALAAANGCAAGLVHIVENPPLASAPPVAPRLIAPAWLPEGVVLRHEPVEVRIAGLTFNGAFEVELAPQDQPLQQYAIGRVAGNGVGAFSLDLAGRAPGHYALRLIDTASGRSSPTVHFYLAEPRVAAQPNPGEVSNGCVEQGGEGFPPSTDVTLVFYDPEAHTSSRENVVRTDAQGRFTWTFGLGCADPGARARAEAYLDRVDPARVGFAARAHMFWGEWWWQRHRRTPVVDYTLSSGLQTCQPLDCAQRACGSDGCGGSCGGCPGDEVCAAGACGPPGAPNLDVCRDIAGDERWTLADSPVRVRCDLRLTGSLQIDPGVVVLMQGAGTSITVSSGGRLDVLGEAADPVRFMAAAGDAPGSWGGISIQRSAGPVRIHHAELRHGGNTNEASAPIWLDPRVGTTPSFRDLRLVGNRIDAIRLRYGTYEDDATVPNGGGAAYWLDWDVTIAENATFTLEAGAVVKFGYAYADLYVEGRLLANGTPTRPVVFTGRRDDRWYGDSNRDGATQPQAREWGGIYFDENVLLPASELHNVVVAHGGNGATDRDPYPDNPTIGYPILINGYENPLFDNVVFEGNNVDAQALAAGTYNRDVHLDLAGYPYWIPNDLTIGAAGTWTLDAGVVLKFGYTYADVGVMGRLIANGTRERPVVFTSRYDDARGGDTNRDGAVAPAPRQWGGIYFAENQVLPPSELHHTILAHGGQSGTDRNPYPDNPTYGYPILIHPYENPVFDNVTFEDNRIDAQALVVGTFNRDVRLDLAGYPYWIPNDLIIGSASTWSLDAGVVLKFGYGYADIDVNGRLLANGTAQHPVVFTSARDDTRGGDTNRDGAVAPSAQGWGGIYFASDDSLPDSELHHVVVAYGGQDDIDRDPYPDNPTHGYPILIHPYANPVFDHVRFESNRVDAQALRTGSYSRDARLDLAGYPYWIDWDLTIGEAATWTLDAGVVMKFGYAYADIQVEGRLVSNGTAEQPVVFTAGRDDARGGDTNRDGPTNPTHSSWGGIYFANNVTLPPSELHHTVLAYGGQSGIDRDPYPDNGTFDFPILIHPYENPVFDHVRFESNRVDAQALATGTYNHDAVLDLAGYPYWIGWDITIGSAATWRIDPGVILKFGYTYADLDVQGRLIAGGDPARPVVFTSRRDDRFGGDTNRDGATAPQPGDWGGIRYGPDSVLRPSELRGVVLAFGGQGGTDRDPYPDNPTFGYPVRIETAAGVLVEQCLFDRNDDAIYVAPGASADLGGGTLGSRGGNRFAEHPPGSNNWAVYNASAQDVFAYWNEWDGARAAVDIEGMIRDALDSPDVGRVLWDGRQCGDGRATGTEVCDGADLRGRSCGALQGFDGGTLACRADCDAYDTGGCSRCGDGAASGNEVCDGADLREATCRGLGFDGGALGCRADCVELDPGACFRCGDGACDAPDETTVDCPDDCGSRCGDGAINGTEVCEPGQVAQTCEGLGFDGGVLGCGLDCLGHDTGGCTRCGDGACAGGESSVNCFEDCGSHCGDGVCQPDETAIGCNRDCPAVCGDGAATHDEVCDAADLRGATCAQLGFDRGALACRDCAHDTGGCSRCGDGQVDAGEVCDAGAANSDLRPGACRSDCLPARCGDGVVDSEEACDDGPDNDNDRPDACRTDCALPSCGDGVVDEGEDCDEGEANADDRPDACRTTCRLAGCGDGVVDTVELCDAGEANDDLEPDACRTDCRPARCGDSVIDGGEDCDDGEANADDRPDACRTGCRLPRCGDGVLDTGEGCDDGLLNDDLRPGACRTDCQPPFCGDGVVDPDEACDQGPANSDRAPDACRSDCRDPRCGDGIRDTGEACDQGPANADAEPDRCRTTCALPECGDGVIDTGEACDNGAANDDAIAGACRTDCRLPRCGDGVVDPGELCDDGAANSGEPDACRPDCTTAHCGDGVVNLGESCDDGDANANDVPDACRTTCVLASCGDGVVDSGELCDEGAANSDHRPDACRTDCQPAACGDGVVDGGELCDTGPENSDLAPDACRADCRPARCGDGVVDTNETCEGGPGCREDCTRPLCGDGIADAGEACDEGVANSDIEPDACRQDCSLPRCGDGVIDAGEVCDDGPDNSDLRPDACRLDCRLPACGDGVLDDGEACDNGPDNDDLRPDACRHDCDLPVCGDGVVDRGEQCDDGPDNSDVQPDACRTDCRRPWCGDGVADVLEACDDGPDNDDLRPGACRSDCAPPTCGDGVTDADEGCDDGAANSDRRAGACRSNCLRAHCGDGVLDEGEQCDEGPDNSDERPDACRSDCAPPFCGDGVADADEACDDGPDNSNVRPDACRQHCLRPFCGDGVVDSDEACDDGAANGAGGEGSCDVDCDRVVLPSTDAGPVEMDAALPEPERSDAGLPDGGVRPPATDGDTGGLRDATRPNGDAAVSANGGSGGCGVGDRGVDPPWLLLWALMVVAVRRRR